jgi:cell wall assembly regulator SMI1
MAQQVPVTAAWARIDAWLGRNAPDILDTLEPGATEKMIQDFEQRTGLKLPPDLRASYRRHDGADESDLFPALERDEMGYSLLTLSQAFRDWRLHAKRNKGGPGNAPDDFDCDRGVRREYWNDGWIPVATNGGGDYHCVDLGPAPGGTAGQVIEWRHETNERRLVARSWARWLKDVADGLEDGTFACEEGSGIVRGAKRRRTGKPAAPAAKRARKLAPDEKKLLRLVRQSGRPVAWTLGPDDEKYARAVKALDPRRESFRPCGRPQFQALNRFAGFGADPADFYTHFEPKPGTTFNGVRLLSVREMAEATVELGCKRLTVMAVHEPTGTRFAFDGSRAGRLSQIPIVRIPPGVTPPAPTNRDPFKKDKALAAALGPDAADSITQFLEKLKSPKHRLVK